MHLIETRNLCYSYPGSVKALEGINFIAPRNSRIAVMGSNGAGKSTLFKHFNGILKPTSGSVLVRGEPITKANIREVRKFVGIVFQNPDDQIIAPTVAQDIAFGPTNLGLDKETIHHRVEEALRITGIEHIADRVPHHLSGGEKKGSRSPVPSRWNRKCWCSMSRLPASIPGAFTISSASSMTSNRNPG